MSITVDEIVDVDLEERNGRIVRLRRRVKLSGITATDQVGACTEILASGQLPAAGSTITVNGWLLYLVGRAPQIRESSELADVLLTYEGGQGGGGFGSGELRRGGRTALQLDTTVNDRNGNNIEVTYQGTNVPVELSVYLPQAMPYIETIEETHDPDGLAGQWIGYVNSATWRGKPAGRWIVADVRYDEFNAGASIPLWRFTWSFQESIHSQGWLPVAVYVNPTTNKIPEDIDWGNGKEAIPFYFERDFNSKFS